MAPTLPTMQLDLRQLGAKLVCVVLVAADVGWSLQPAAEMRSCRGLHSFFLIFRLVQLMLTQVTSLEDIYQTFKTSAVELPNTWKHLGTASKCLVSAPQLY